MPTLHWASTSLAGEHWAAGQDPTLCSVQCAGAALLFWGRKGILRDSLSHLPLSHREAHKEMAFAGVPLDGRKVIMGD